jgi:hypothetical protein
MNHACFIYHPCCMGLSWAHARTCCVLRAVVHERQYGIDRPPPPHTQYVNVAENISSSIDNVQCTMMIIIISSASISSSVDIVIMGNPVARYVVGGHTGLPEYHPHVDRHTDAVRGGGGGGKNWNSTSPGLSAKFR